MVQVHVFHRVVLVLIQRIRLISLHSLLAPALMVVVDVGRVKVSCTVITDNIELPGADTAKDSL